MTVELTVEAEGVAADIWLPAKVLDTNPEGGDAPKMGDAPVSMKAMDARHSAVASQDMTVLLVKDSYVISMDMEQALRATRSGAIQAAGNVSDAKKYRIAEALIWAFWTCIWGPRTVFLWRSVCAS